MNEEQPPGTLFWWPAGGGVCVAIILVFTHFLFSIISYNDQHEYEVFRRNVLLGASKSEQDKTNSESDKLAYEIGAYLRDAHDKGIQIKPLVVSVLGLRVGYSAIAGDEDKKKFLTAVNDTTLHLKPGFLPMMLSDTWAHVSSDSFITQINVVMSRAHPHIPPVVEKYIEWTPIIYWYIVTIQFFVCAFYLRSRWRNNRGRSGHDRNKQFRWYHAQWGKPGTYLVALCLLPGAVPLILLALLMLLLNFNVRKAFKNHQERKAKTHASHNVALSDVSLDSRGVLDNLRKRQGGSHVADET